MESIVPVVYACCLAVVTVYGMNQGWLAWKRAGKSITPVSHASSRSDLPTVTVQLPLFNEALVARRLIDAVAALDYPRSLLRIQVLDDSTDATSAIASERVRFWREEGLSIIHIRRTSRSGFKAGALAEGLRATDSELIAVFDADFVPQSDFLRSMVPHFEDERTGCVQARWTYLNADVSLLTKLQSMGLDAHFETEQSGRHEAGYGVNFNGTAGLWRRACIEDAGGWSSDTLTEDLDLSYRAQLAGWRLRFHTETEAPSELPVSMMALRSQQRRWTVGAAQCAVKLLPLVVRSTFPRSRIQAVLHLTAPVAYPCVVLLALLNAPVGLMQLTASSPGPAYYAGLSFGSLGLAGYVAAHVATQRGLYADWRRRLRWVPLLLAASMGMALSNSVAIVQALAGRGGPFVRTPKFADSGGGVPWWRFSNSNKSVPYMVLFEALFATVLTAGAVALVLKSVWGALPFQLLFAGGTWLVVGVSLSHAFKQQSRSSD